MESTVKLVVLSAAAVSLSLCQFGKEPFKMAGFRTGHLRQKQLDNRFNPDDFNQGSVDNRFNPDDFNQGSVDNRFNPDGFNQGSVDNRFNPDDFNQGSVDNRFNPDDFNQGSVDNRFNPDGFNQGSVDNRFNPDDFNQGSVDNLFNPDSVDTDGFNFGPDIHGQFGARQIPLQVTTPAIPILYEDKNGPDASGVYSFSFESADGTRRQESGRPTSPDTFSVQGSYSYISPEGIPFEVRYVADEFGFRAEGDHLPTPPPAPLHALQQIQAAEEAFSRQRDQQQTPVNFQDPFVNIIPPTVNFQQVPSFQQRGKSLHQQTEKDIHPDSSSDIDHQVDLKSHAKFESKRNARSL